MDNCNCHGIGHCWECGEHIYGPHVACEAKMVIKQHDALLDRVRDEGWNAALDEAIRIAKIIATNNVESVSVNALNALKKRDP